MRNIKVGKKRRVKVVVAMGTRPEAIKLVPLLWELNKGESKKFFNTIILLTSQHDELLKQVLSVFKIRSDYDFGIMRSSQSLSLLSSRLAGRFQEFFAKNKPDLFVVQGDTTSAFIGALTAFYCKIKVVHVEAGLRTFNSHNPFPEEINRKFISALTDIHFAPTDKARSNLIDEGVRPDLVYLTGNTVVDVVEFCKRNNLLCRDKNFLPKVDFGKKIIYLTSHRRENQGVPLRNICEAVRDIIEKYSFVECVCPVHPSPKVKNTIYKILSNHSRIHLIPPLDYFSSLALLQKSYLVLTDSGGLQEEAPSFRKPVLVLRELTERVEGIEVNCAKLIGVNKDNIKKEVGRLLVSETEYKKMVPLKSPYGDGRAAKRIVKFLRQKFVRYSEYES